MNRMIDKHQRKLGVTSSIYRCQDRLARMLLIGALSWLPMCWGDSNGSHGNDSLLADEATVVDIQSREITESSGLAASNRVAGHFWTHNDSGGEPKLIAIDANGAVTGSVMLDNAEAIDWEDVASFTDGTSMRLVVADVGDNDSRRDYVTIYVIDEPDPRQHGRTAMYSKISVRYPEGPRDCEAIGIDLEHRQILLVGKSFLPLAPVYSLALPDPSVHPKRLNEPVMLTRVGTLAVPLVSGMDVNPRSGDLFLVNYFQCFHYKVEKGEPFGDWVSRVPDVTDLPRLRQIEAVAVDGKGAVWVTSEGSPGKLSRLSLVNEQDLQVTK
jgi:hypothetical protein